MGDSSFVIALSISHIVILAFFVFLGIFGKRWAEAMTMTLPPNQSPEPTAVAAAVAIHAASRRWLSFFR